MRLLLGLIFVSWMPFLSAQEITLSGVVTDDSGEPVVGVTVADTVSRRGTATNSAGYFSLRVPGGRQVLRFSHVSYGRVVMPLAAVRDSSLAVSLAPRSADEVTITAEALALRPLSQMSLTQLPMTVVKQLPALMGERDVLKVLALTPGVTTGTEGTSGLLVRGGTPDQNLMLLDGAPVYNASHLFGFLSVFNPDAIKDVALYKGGFPARYGGRLSSVLDITLREGATSEHRGEAGIGLLASRLLFEGPIGKQKKGSYLISGRASYLGVLLLPLRVLYNEGSVTTYVNYWMSDLNAKVNYATGPRSRLSFSIYGGLDDFAAIDGFSAVETRFGLRWGNRTATLRHTHLIGSKWFGQAMGIYSTYQYGLSFRERNTTRTGDSTVVSTQQVRSRSLVEDWGVRYKLEGYLSSSLTVRFGLETTRHLFNPSLFTVTSDSVNEEQGADPIITFETGLYAEATWKPVPKAEVNAGFRLSTYHVDGRNFAGPEPRLSAGYRLPGDVLIKASYSRMYQYLHLLTNSGVGLPNDIWVPVTSTIPPSTADQAAIGLERAFPSIGVNVSVEAYVKRLTSLTDYARGSNFLEVFGSDWQRNLITGGEGRVRGLEVFVQRDIGRLTGWAAYTWSVNERRFADTGPEWYPFRFDRPHVANLTLMYALSKKWRVSGTYVFQSGFPVTVPIGRAESPEGGFSWIYGSKGNYRTTSYQRVDIGFDRTSKTKKGNEKVFSIGCYNVLNRRNTFYVEQSRRTDQVTGVSTWSLRERAFLPILPYMAWAWKF